MMIKRLIDARLTQVKLFHLRMSFSNNERSVGKFRVKKIFHLGFIILNAIKYKFRYKIEILYYFPSGPKLNPIIRDFFILMLIRPFFSKTVFHFRAAGISEYLNQKNRVLQKILSLPYRNPDIAIQLSDLNPEDGKYFHAERTLIVPNGIEDKYSEKNKVDKKSKNQIDILYIGALHRSKGIFNLLEAAQEILKLNKNVFFNFIGQFYDDKIEDEFNQIINKYNLQKNIKLYGLKINDSKWDFFYNADILCFPTYFESESFGNVLLEAMMFELPIVGTKWRGIPGIVHDKENGLLVNPNDSVDLADKLLILIQDQEKRIQYGERGRKIFLEKYTLQKHIKKMNDIFLSI